MKPKVAAAISYAFILSSLTASPMMPSGPGKPFNPVDTVKIVFVYALGEWDNPQGSHHHGEDTPLPGYVFDICDTVPPSVPSYYKSVSMRKFMVSAQAWHNNKNCYVMQGMHTPTSYTDTTKGAFVDSLIKRIDREGVWSFADNAMWWPNNDKPGVNDTPLVWIFVVWPEPYGGGWGQAPGGWWTVWLIPTNDSLYNPVSKTFKKVYVQIFGLSRQPSSYHGDAVAGIVHEFNHQWFPDIGYNPDHYGLGGFDPECAGMGFYDSKGSLPTPLNPVWRAEAGWINKVGLPGANLNRTLHDVTKDTVYCLGSFYVSVHLGQNYYESKWPGQGLLIWHQKMSPTGFNFAGEDCWSDSNYLVKPLDLEVASGNWRWNGLTPVTLDPVQGRDNLDMRPYGFYESDANRFKGVGDSSCFFNPNYGYKQFDGLTNPSSRNYVSSHDTLGAYGPQDIAVRNIRTYSATAMKADMLCNYCIGSIRPGGGISSGSNNQRSIVTASTWLDEWGKYRFYTALLYVEDDSLWIRVAEDLSKLSQARRQLVCGGTSPQFPSFFSHGQNDRQLAVCWFDGSSLLYRHGTLDTNRVIQWNNEPFALSSLTNWSAFTAPSIVVRPDDTVFIASGVSCISSFLDNSYTMPVVCFRFHKFHPEEAKIDVLSEFYNDSFETGSFVSLAIDEQRRVHAVYLVRTEGATLQGLGYRCMIPGDTCWRNQMEVIPANTDYNFIGAPCLDCYDGYLNMVAAADNPGTLHSNVYYSSFDAKGANISGQWTIAERLSDDGCDASEPIICGGPVSADKYHIFWTASLADNETDLFYKKGHLGKIANLSCTPHALSSSPQALFADGRCFVSWCERNSFGSELDLRTLTVADTFGGIPGNEILPSGALKLELSSSVLSGSQIHIRYILPQGVGPAVMRIYDCQGRLTNQWRIFSSNGSISWNGENTAGQAVACGVYFIRLETAGLQTGCKVVKLQ